MEKNKFLLRKQTSHRLIKKQHLINTLINSNYHKSRLIL